MAIGFVDYARVQNNDDAGISFVADKPAETLLEFKNSRRQLIFIKRISTLLFYLL